MIPKKHRKTKGILIRVTEAQKRLLAQTAKSTGLGLSSWMLSLARALITPVSLSKLKC
jgi:uncharacterized protein (DUF1778 family)